MESSIRRLAVAFIFAPLALGASAQDTDMPQAARDKLATLRDTKAFESAYKQGAKLASFCANCHGDSGHSVRPDVPNLAGQNTAYVLNQIYKFAEGKRPNAFFMEGFVKAMSTDERFAVAVYYSSQQPTSLPAKDTALAGRGKQIYDSICKSCHGERGTGNETIARLAGQQPDYLVASIKRYREGLRLDPRMLANVRSLNDADMRAVAAYIGSL